MGAQSKVISNFEIVEQGRQVLGQPRAEPEIEQGMPVDCRWRPMPRQTLFRPSGNLATEN